MTSVLGQRLYPRRMLGYRLAKSRPLTMSKYAPRWASRTVAPAYFSPSSREIPTSSGHTKPLARAHARTRLHTLICWPRRSRYDTGTVTALVISRRFSRTASLVVSASGSRVSLAAYAAMTARSALVPLKRSKICAAGRSSLASPRNFSDTALSEYLSSLYSRRTYCNRSRLSWPGVASMKNALSPYAADFRLVSTGVPAFGSPRTRPNALTSTSGSPVWSSTSTPMRPAR